MEGVLELLVNRRNLGNTGNLSEPAPLLPTVDTQNSSLLEDIFWGFFKMVIFIVIALAPVIPYIKQYMIIKVKRDVGAFSSLVCAILLYGQSFRILFWFAHHFQVALLVQSFVLIISQVTLKTYFLVRYAQGLCRMRWESAPTWKS
jgi:hypothetical protein